MKYFILRMYVLLIALVTITGIQAQDVTTEVDGITYLLDNETKTAVVSQGATSLVDVVIPEKVKYDGAEYTVTEIGTSAFGARSSVTTISLPESVTTIGEGAFKNVRKLQSIAMPGVTTIGVLAFSSCTSLTELTLPEGLTTIGKSAFYRSGLTTVTLPQSLTNIEESAFIQ